jgi:hypothetical protein
MVGWRERPRSSRSGLSRLGPERASEVDVRLPIFVLEHDIPPRLFGTEGERTLPQADERIWWPADFQAVLVDRFHHDTGQDLGSVFLRWLSDVHFAGPVGVITRVKAPPSTFPHLAVRAESKLDAGWERRAADDLVARLAARVRKGGPYVGTRGMDPTDFDVLSRFFATRGDERAPVEWKTLWLGTDESARKALLRFFPSLSPVEPDTQWSFQWSAEFPDVSGLKDDPVPVVQAWLEVLERVRNHTDFPQLLWIDLGPGSELTPEFIKRLVEGLSTFSGDRGLSFLTVVLVDEWLKRSDEEAVLLRHGVVVEYRNLLLGAPVLWLEGTMDGLSEAWYQFIGVAKRPEPEDFVRFIRFYFRALLVAHTRGRLVSGRSLAEWFTSYPGGSRVSTTLVKQLGGKVWKKMPPDTVSPRLERHFMGDPGR